MCEYKCSNGSCIPTDWSCDGVDDCGDNGDENNCGKVISGLLFKVYSLNQNTSNIHFHFLLQEVSEQRPCLQLQTTRTGRPPPPRLQQMQRLVDNVIQVMYQVCNLDG